MAIPKNKLSCISEIILQHYEEGTNPFDTDYVINGEQFELTPQNVVVFFIDNKLSLEFIKP